MLSFFVGEELETGTKNGNLQQSNQTNQTGKPLIGLQCCGRHLNLLGRSENPSRLIGSVYDEEQALSHAIAVKDRNIRYLFKQSYTVLSIWGVSSSCKTAVLARQYVEEVQAITYIPFLPFSGAFEPIG